MVPSIGESRLTQVSFVKAPSAWLINPICPYRKQTLRAVHTCSCERWFYQVLHFSLKQCCIFKTSVAYGICVIVFHVIGGGWVVRWSWVNFQCRGVLLVWIRVGQGPIALAVGAGGGGLDIFTLIYPFSPFSPSLRETTRYRLKYCLKGSLSPKTTNKFMS